MNSTKNFKSENKAKPFLKWAGGKGQLLKQFENHYPSELKDGKIKHYYEPFVGGGAVFFDIIQKYNIETATLFDINEELILCYQVIKHNLESILDFLKQYEKQYIPLDKKDRKAYFYDIRDTFNRDRFDINRKKYSENWIPRAAQIIFLNKTCYNGLFRFNNSGAFNSPSGDYVNPKICDEENLAAVSHILQNTEIICANFDEILNNIQSSSFVYLDPPYRPLNLTSSFTSYSKHSFTDKHQQMLANVYKKLDKKNALLMLSNSDPKNTNKNDNFFDDIYSDFKISRVAARRSINSKASKRGPVNEIIVTNY